MRAVLNELNDDLQRKLRLTRSIDHPGESGRARETIVRNFLASFLPTDLRIDTGFVMDAIGGKSRQIDIVIYRSNYHPVFEIGDVKHFLAEGVLAVIENKAAITSRETLRMALENIRSVKALDRTNAGRNYRVVGTQRGPPADPDHFNDQIFGAICTEASLARVTLEEEFLGFLRATPRREWFNFYADIRGIEASFARREGEGWAVTCRTEEAARLYVVERQRGEPGPLVELGAELANFLRVATLIDWSPQDYLERAGATSSVEI